MNPWRKRIVLWAAVLALLVTIGVIVQEQEADASACVGVDKVWPLEEGAIGFDTAKVDVAGVLCSAPSGWFDQAASQVDMTIRTTFVGKGAGFNYWRRSGPFKTEDTASFQTFRTYFAYQTCFVNVAPMICFPTARFAVNVRYVDSADQPPQRVRRWISNRSEHAADVHFS